MSPPRNVNNICSRYTSLVVIRGYPLALVLLGASSTSAAARTQSGCPADSQATLESMRLDGEGWTVDCGADKSGRIIFAASRPPKADQPIKIVVLIFGADGQTRRTEHSIEVTDPPVRQVMCWAEECFVHVVPNQFGSKDILRVNLVGRFGADFWFGQEVVSFFQIDAYESNLLWSGRGDREEVRLDSCVIDELASFRLTKDGKLERSIKGKRSFRNADLPDKVAAALRKECLAPHARREIFPLRPAR